ncbi:uncharacterized protein [Littorina saxatilis]|uniref:uncharacterized protein n=1 Tax=Littorina saxatilis TaxID=31220 RepID=UPI0038B498DC
MGNWSANNGYASVSQSGNSNIGASVYSVLESPWVNFSKPSCVEFTYSRGATPYQIQVFLAFNNVEQPFLVKDSNSVPNNQNRTARFSIKPMTGKIQFRVLGGGATWNTPPPKLYHVTVVEDSCVHQDGQSTTSNCTQASVTTISSTTWHPTTSDRTCPTLSTDGDIPSPDGESDNSAAAIAGVVVTVVVLIVVIIVVVLVCMRKRRQSKPDDENRNTEDLSMTTGGRRDPSRSSDTSNYYLTPLNVYDGLTNRNLEEHAYADMTNQNNTYEVLTQDRGDTRPYDSLAARNNAELTEQGASACSEYYNTVSPPGWGSSSSKKAPATSNGSDNQNI